MKSRLAILVLSLGSTSWITAQNTAPLSPGGTLTDIVEELQASRPGKLNEVTVVLPPPDETTITTEAPAADGTASEASDSGENEQASAEAETEKPEPAAPDAVEDETATTENPVVDSPKEPEPGLSVRIERIQTGSTEMDPTKVKLLAPFPAKLLARPPDGWHIESSEDAPPFTREVELSPGKHITLNVRPHLLVAEADGSSVFQVEEPGFDPALGYRQHATVAAILSTSIRQLEDDSMQLGTAIDKLQQLLVSLPQPPSAPEPKPEPKPKPNRKR